LSPLGSTPQTIIVEDKNSSSIVDISRSHSEPIDSEKTLMNVASTAKSSVQRARYRKKSFDKLFSERNKQFVTDPKKVYTFEFLQHLIDFDDLSIELGSVFGSIAMSELLNGQPIQIRACHLEQKLWSFDVWHELLYNDAIRHDDDK
jgi:Protein of unknown function (DUF1769)